MPWLQNLSLLVSHCCTTQRANCSFRERTYVLKRSICSSGFMASAMLALPLLTGFPIFGYKLYLQEPARHNDEKRQGVGRGSEGFRG